MKNVCVSLKTLYEEFDGELNEGVIVKSTYADVDYYDLHHLSGIVCMDGEECEVINEYDDYFVLVNRNGEEDMEFTLTHEEMNVGAFGLR